MPANTFGTNFRLTTFGESHGPALGGVIDGCPSGLAIDLEFVQKELDRRRPGQSNLVSQRKEWDKVEFLSGIFEGKTTGAPIGFIIRNENQKPDDYNYLKDLFRPSHADYTYYRKYGHRDYRGGGRASARETAARVVGGAISKLILRQSGIKIFAYTSQVGDIKLNKSYKELNLEKIDSNPVRCPDAGVALKMEKKIVEVRKEGDTIGGVISCVIMNVPVCLGEPLFDKLQARLAHAMLTIPAAKGFDYGLGFEGVSIKGSEANDIFYVPGSASIGRHTLLSSRRGAGLSRTGGREGEVRTKTNFSGGIQGGISNGEDIYFRVAFKPVSTIMKKQKTVNIYGNEVEYMGKGRHDPCVLPRAVPVVEAMAGLVMIDFLLLDGSRYSDVFSGS